MPYRRTICAAPGYIKHHGRPMAPADLAQHRCLKLPHEKVLTTWEVDDPERKGLRLGSGLVCNSLDALTAACLAGEGIACLPDFLTQENLSLERLMPVLEGSSKPSEAGSVSILRPETAITPRRMSIFSDFLYGHIRKEVIPKKPFISLHN
jgi:DNA-binding transcriptional LysR family regulator